MSDFSCQHLMPFGTQRLAGGGAAFRLWAPAAGKVELCLGRDLRSPPDAVFPMKARGEGWFEYRHEDISPGALYFFLIDGEHAVPDPASRFQPHDLHAPSELIDPSDYRWGDAAWRGRAWEEAAIYELHLGAFSPEGGFDGLRRRLDYLLELGVNTLELMPVADFPGRRNWGYDGALPFAPDSVYGRPEALKALVDEAHRRGLSVLLDVVYNHFGPEGNYIGLYAPQFSSSRHHTPWGKALNFDGEGSRQVRDFFIHNALYWLEEFRFDGLRFDAVHAIIDADDSEPDFLTELSGRLRAFEAVAGRPLHLVLENDHNSARYLARGEDGRPRQFSAQWNDDIHHCLHLLLTGEDEGYYRDYRDAPLHWLARCLAEGFAWQGEASPYRDGRPRGEASGALPPAAFVSFLQNHDQCGNRALGERLSQLAEPEGLRAATALLLLAPFPPLLFMGQVWGSRRPFLYFCDFEEGLVEPVREGRRQEFAKFPAFADSEARERIPDPFAEETFRCSKLDWEERRRPEHAAWFSLHRELLAIRRRRLQPRLPGTPGGQGPCRVLEDRGLHMRWILGDGSALEMLANFSGEPLRAAHRPGGCLLYPTAPPEGDDLPPWSLYCWLDDAAGAGPAREPGAGSRARLAPATDGGSDQADKDNTP